MTDNEKTQVDFDQMLREEGSHVRDALAGLIGPASPSAVFSEPHAVGDDVVITAAAWERGGGFGFGAGLGDDPRGGGGSGGGGGGGGGSQGRPVAVIRVGRGGIEVRPVIDFTKIGLTILISGLGVWRALRRTK
ncbi:MAG TPA: hypothetical protein VE569_11355 [Acidimicrobiia bacterium]|jgi:uncharacterized spore protein YtfJ|nr:hypothetical protein [Acidimicrobiia bacterium]